VVEERGMGWGEAKNSPLDAREKTTNDAKEGKQATEKTPHNSAHQPLLFDLVEMV